MNADELPSSVFKQNECRGVGFISQCLAQQKRLIAKHAEAQRQLESLVYLCVPLRLVLSGNLVATAK
jgi:hypothetical protein